MLISKDTGVGNPKASTKLKRTLFFNTICKKPGNLFVEISNADTNNLYEQTLNITI
ncbi:hypothetical protein [Aquimarina sp. AU58]|uniref:hypothetical protein n=1 Tax=Aquimarina sp. AU58 TaxID=1874112 RepID=UPI00135B9C88|nr:hypothetical protein [Aquimarina sp. AU58]